MTYAEIATDDRLIFDRAMRAVESTTIFEMLGESWAVVEGYTVGRGFKIKLRKLDPFPKDPTW